MNASSKRYNKALKKKLCCSSTAQKALLARFQESLTKFQEEHPDPDAQALYDAFGPPEEMAKILMEEVPQKDVETYRRKKVFLRVIAGILVAALVLFAIYVFFLKQNPIIVEDEYYIKGTISSEADPKE